jgi:hypothetical protein
MRRCLLTVIGIVLTAASLSRADEFSATIGMLEGAHADSEHIRSAVGTVQRMVPEEVELCQNLCDAVELSSAQVESMLLRAKENGLNPATQVDILEQFARFQELSRQLQSVATDIYWRYPY